MIVKWNNYGKNNPFCMVFKKIETWETRYGWLNTSFNYVDFDSCLEYRLL